MGIDLNTEKKVIETGTSDFISANFCSSTSLLVVLVILIVVVKSLAVTVAAVHFYFVNLIFGSFALCNIKLVTYSGRINRITCTYIISNILYIMS